MKIFTRGIEISDSDVKCLENDLLDIEEWVQGAIDGKINNCKKRLLREWQPRLLLDPDVKTIPANETALIEYITARSDYQNRSARDTETLPGGDYFDSPEYAESLEVADVETA